MMLNRAVAMAMSALALVVALAFGAVAFMLAGGDHQLFAPGSVVFDKNPIEVRTRVAGMIAELRVRNGEPVSPGDVLVRLDGESIRSSLVALLRVSAELTARRARLRAEQSKAADVAFSDDLQLRARDPEIGAMLIAEVELFNTRRAIQNAQAAELLDRINKLQKEIKAYDLQAAAKGRELELVMAQLKSARELRAKSLISNTSLATMERDAIRLQGERDGVLAASIAQAEGRIAETRFLMTQVERERDADIMRDLRDTESKLADVSERQRTAEDQMHRLEITAPQAGIVDMSVSRAVGSMVSTGDQIASISPSVEGFAVQASIGQADITALRVGQSVTVQLPVASGEQAQLAGTLSQIAPVAGDGSIRQQTYKARIDLTPADCSRVGPVQPGTEARVMLRGSERSMLSSVLAPVGNGISRILKAI